LALAAACNATEWVKRIHRVPGVAEIVLRHKIQTLKLVVTAAGGASQKQVLRISRVPIVAAEFLRREIRTYKLALTAARDASQGQRIKRVPRVANKTKARRFPVATAGAAHPERTAEGSAVFTP
jgi:hypothetical protein